MVQLRDTRKVPDEIAMVNNGSRFFQWWSVHKSIC
ncbi:hypothetical protein ABH944_006246 [Caballeronia udeis]|uniref:Uncharacterized protein n=1 Tax=Caballeronia udeis TaxID=1232866 RepID=A0ABW8MTJ3_9BURK